MSDAVSEIINDYLSNVRQRLRHLPEDERVAIVDSLESHIHEALASRCPEMEPTPDDVKAVLAKMDPPEAFGAENEANSRVSAPQRWLRRTLFLLATIFVTCSLLAAYAMWGQRQLYVGRVKLMERQPSQRGVEVYGRGPGNRVNRIAGAPDVYSPGFRKKAILRALEPLKALGMDTTPEALSAVTEIKPIPGSRIIAVEVTEPDRAQAEAEVQSLAAEMQLTYSKMIGFRGGNPPSLKIIEEAHVYPVNMGRPSRVIGALAVTVAQFSLLLLVFIGAAYLWARVQDAARQR